MRRACLGLTWLVAMTAPMMIARASPPPRPGPPARVERGAMRPGRIFAPLTEQEARDILDFVAEYLPGLREELGRLRQENPDQYGAYMRRLRFDVRHLQTLQTRDQKAFLNAIEERRLRLQARDIAAKVRSADDEAAKARLIQQLHAVGKALFDAEMATREAEIRLLEERINEVRRNLKDRAAKRDAIIASRIEQMLSPGGPDADPRLEDDEPGPIPPVRRPRDRHPPNPEDET